MRKKKILVVDDEENVRRLVRRILGKENIILEAGDGEITLDIARSQKPDLILMDISMPKMDGYTACYKLKNNEVTKAIPVVMLTGIGFALNKKLADEVGAVGYITKPFSPQELLDVVSQFLPTR